MQQVFASAFYRGFHFFVPYEPTPPAGGGGDGGGPFIFEYFTEHFFDEESNELPEKWDM